MSSTLFLLGVSAAGVWFKEMAGRRTSVAVALALAGLLLLLDGMRLWGGRSTSFGPKRQTPYDWRLRGRVGVVAWGVDTGLPVSTVRATPLPVLGVILAATGHSLWFYGLFYGFGLTLGVLAGLPWARSFVRIDWAMAELQRRHRRINPVLLVVPSGLTVVALVSALVLG
ncbi:MAG: hypothetical protein OXI56_05855 [bacterium]|nr:hypothetical protein [bacterium]MDE0601302.1 hypothetical protein [bacterium]